MCAFVVQDDVYLSASIPGFSQQVRQVTLSGIQVGEMSDSSEQRTYIRQPRLFHRQSDT